jgi:hypothetical protein
MLLSLWLSYLHVAVERCVHFGRAVNEMKIKGSIRTIIIPHALAIYL